MKSALSNIIKDQILLVGDRTFRDTLMAYLKFSRMVMSLPFGFISAPSAENALLLLHKSRGINCILIISEFKLPGRNGIVLHRELQRTSYRKIPFLLISGALKEDEWKEIDLLNLNWLKRPITEERFTQRITTLLGGRKMSGIIMVIAPHATQSVFKSYLETSGLASKINFRVVPVYSDYEAIKTLSGNHVDAEQCLAIVSDFNVPGVDMLDFISVIKGDRDFSKIPLMIISNDLETSQIEALARMGVIYSPNRAQAFRANLEELLGVKF